MYLYMVFILGHLFICFQQGRMEEFVLFFLWKIIKDITIECFFMLGMGCNKYCSSIIIICICRTPNPEAQPPSRGGWAVGGPCCGVSCVRVMLASTVAHERSPTLAGLVRGEEPRLK